MVQQDLIPLSTVLPTNNLIVIGCTRRDGGVTALCDSCANYSKMNSLRGLNSANTGGPGGGMPDRSAASRRAEGGGRRVSANVSLNLI